MREIENIQHGNYFSIAKANNTSQDSAPEPALLSVHRGCGNSLRLSTHSFCAFLLFFLLFCAPLCLGLNLTTILRFLFKIRNSEKLKNIEKLLSLWLPEE